MQTWRLLWMGLLWMLPMVGVWWTLERAPTWQQIERLRITLAPGQTQAFGAADLGAVNADADHIEVRRTAQGTWLLLHRTTAKQVLWKPTHTAAYRPVRQWSLHEGDQIMVGTQPLTARALTPTGLVLEMGTTRWLYDGVRLQHDGQGLPPCGDRRWETVAMWIGVRRPLHIGGSVHCAHRLGISDLPADTVGIHRAGDEWIVRYAGAQTVPVRITSSQTLPLHAVPLPLAVGQHLIIGYTEYRIEQVNAHSLVWRVVRRGQRQPATIPWHPPHDAVQFITQPVDFMTMQHLDGWQALPWQTGWPLLPGLLMSLMALRCRYQRDSTDRALIASALYALLAGISVLFYQHPDLTPILWPYSLLWVSLAQLLYHLRAWPLSARLVRLTLLLLGVGLIAQLQWEVGSAEGGWARYGIRQAALSSAAIYSVLALHILLQGQTLPPRTVAPWIKRVLVGMATVALLLLAIQTVDGTEAGWRGIQPVELAKLALIMTLAHGLAMRIPLRGYDQTVSAWTVWRHYLWPAVLLLALIIMALIFLHDLSPLLLLLIALLTVMGSYWHSHPERRWRWRGLGGLLIIGGLLGWGIASLYKQADQLDLLHQDRFLVWVHPEQYPHSGYQVMQARRAIQQGGWMGAGFSTPWDQPIYNGRVMKVPALQDDFALTFFLHSYGGVAGTLLLILHLTWLGRLFAIANRTLMVARHYQAAEHGDYRRAYLGWLGYFTLMGSGGFLLAHLVVSWGTNLGFLPVMGQPLTWLSNAGSHLLLFTGPILGIAVWLESYCQIKSPVAANTK